MRNDNGMFLRKRAARLVVFEQMNEATSAFEEYVALQKPYASNNYQLQDCQLYLIAGLLIGYGVLTQDEYAQAINEASKKI